MRKLIASLSITLSIVFAVALASAEDNSTPSPDPQRSGEVRSHDETMSSTTTTATEASRSCTDSNGVTYRKGQKGFDRCMSAQKNTQPKDQMGGQVGTSPTNEPSSIESPDSTLPEESTTGSSSTND